MISAQFWLLPGPTPQVKVGDICEDNPFEVKPSAQIDDVAEIMAEKKLAVHS